MGFWEVFLIGVGLAMDAVAAAVCEGLSMKVMKFRRTFVISLFLGGFQALMPFIGWLLGRRFEVYIKSIDHWVAFVLLLFIGIKMLHDAVSGGDSIAVGDYDKKLSIKALLVMSVATSVDALAMGVSFAFLSVNIYSSIAIIGITTFVMAFAGVAAGCVFGAKYKNKATFAGGLILIAMGFKILVSHLA